MSNEEDFDGSDDGDDFSASEDDWEPGNNEENSSGSDFENEVTTEEEQSFRRGKTKVVKGKTSIFGKKKAIASLKLSAGSSSKLMKGTLKEILEKAKASRRKSLGTNSSLNKSEDLRVNDKTQLPKVVSEDEEESSSSGDEYLVDPAALDLKSSFFENRKSNELEKKPESRVPTPNFDCNAGMGEGRLSDSEDEEEFVEADDPALQKSASTFEKLGDFAKNLDLAKENLKNYVSNAPENELDVSDLLKMGEATGDQEVKKPTSQKRPHANDSESDWEEVEGCALDENLLKPENIHITLDLSSEKRKDKRQTELETAIKRQINKERREAQLVLHQSSIKEWIDQGNHLNKTLNNIALYQMTLKLLPSTHAYPKDKADLKYFEQVTKWFKTIIKISSNDVHPKLMHDLELKKSLSEEIVNKAVCCRRDFILIFVILLRAIGIQCRLVINLVTPPIRPPLSELCRITDKPKEEKSITKNKVKLIKKKKKVEDSSSEEEDDDYNDKSITKNKRKSTSKKKKKVESSSSEEDEDYDEIAKNLSGKDSTRKSVNLKSKSQDKSDKKINGNVRASRTTTKSVSKSDPMEGSSTSMNSKSDSKEENTSSRNSSRGNSNLNEGKSKSIRKPKSSKADKKEENSASNAHSTKSSNSDAKEGSSSSKIKTTKNSDLDPKNKENSSKTNLNSDTKEEESTDKITGTQTRQKTTKEPKKAFENNRSSQGKTLNSRTKAISESKTSEKIKSLNAGSQPSPRKLRNKSNNKPIVENCPQLDGMDELVPRITRSRSKTPVPKEQEEVVSKTIVMSKEDKDSPLRTRTGSKRNRPNLARLTSEKNLKDTVTASQSSSEHFTLQKSEKDKSKPATEKPSSSGLSSKVTVEVIKSETKKTKRKIAESDEDFEVKKSKGESSPKKVDRRVLSTDEEKKPDVKIKVEKNEPIRNDFWVEVWLEKEEKWVTVDLFKPKVDCLDLIMRQATNPIAYVFGWNNDSTIKDISARYCPQWHSVTRKLRVEPEWLQKCLKKYVGKPTARDKKEDDDLSRMQLDRPIPTAISEFKNHPLYALKRHLLKFEAIYPPDAPTLGFIRGEPIYARECVHTLHSREIWVKQARVVKPKETPYKVVTARPKWERQTQTVIKDIPLEIFGQWQTNEYEPPVAENGIVPRNAYGNVELFKACMLPINTVHLPYPGLKSVCKKLNIDCAPAVVGFDFHGGWSHPVFDGFVVCKEFAEIVTDAWIRDAEESEKREKQKYEDRVYGNWKKLIKGLLIKKRLQLRYNFNEKDDADNPGPVTCATTA